METLKRLVILVLLVLGARLGRASGQMLTTVYSFSGSDGGNPIAGLVRGSDGSFYGTTSGGGLGGKGTVFRISPTGVLTNLHSFAGSPSDGANPWAGLVQGSDGNFYGTTEYGGASTNCTMGCGTVFRISPGGSVTNLYEFNGADGADPFAGLVQGSDSNFYGTTFSGGVSRMGTVFRISSGGSLTNLHSFSGSPSDGSYPIAGLVQGSDGNFYGTTQYGGASGYGTVFRISPNGSLTNLYIFNGPDGGYPVAGLVLGSDGDFYGTTYAGGVSTNCFDGCGAVFRSSPDGSLTTLHSFSGSDGVSPYGVLVQGSDGYFYGTTYAGGVSGYGTVFRLCVPLNPPANQISAIYSSGTNIVISIPSVAGETYQLQFRDSLTDGDWTNVAGASVTNSIGALMTLTNSGGALQPQRFYRFVITP
jgi:uncharacterized repeat protein (TIGR03803 family)